MTLSIVLSYAMLVVYFNLRIRVYFKLPIRVVLLSYSLIVLTTIVLYLLACDPLPPCAGTVRQWLRGLVGSRLAASESNQP